MSLKIIQIDQDKCIGCGLCVNTCHQSSIALVDGKAKVVNEDFCDGLGRCLPGCPVDAISFSKKDIKNKSEQHLGCSSSKSMNLNTNRVKQNSGCQSAKPMTLNINKPLNSTTNSHSNLRQWPVQIKLVSSTASFFENANILIAADCSAFAHPNFNATYMQNKVVLIGCPKLDSGNYHDKLLEIFTHNNISSVTVVKMEVPCCNGLAGATKEALIDSLKHIPYNVITLSVNGEEL